LDETLTVKPSNKIGIFAIFFLNHMIEWHSLLPENLVTLETLETCPRFHMNNT